MSRIITFVVVLSGLQKPRSVILLVIWASLLGRNLHVYTTFTQAVHANIVQCIYQNIVSFTIKVLLLPSKLGVSCFSFFFCILDSILSLASVYNSMILVYLTICSSRIYQVYYCMFQLLIFLIFFQWFRTHLDLFIVE